MGWSIGYDTKWERDIGYGVPATCDYPGCGKEIDCGLSYVCADSRPYGGDGCGLYFCGAHLRHYDNLGPACERCGEDKEPFEPTPDIPRWLQWKLTDESWQHWRDENPEEVAKIKQALGARSRA